MVCRGYPRDLVINFCICLAPLRSTRTALRDPRDLTCISRGASDCKKPSGRLVIEGPWVDLGVANVPGRFAPGDPWTPRSGPGLTLGRLGLGLLTLASAPQRSGAQSRVLGLTLGRLGFLILGACLGAPPSGAQSRVPGLTLGRLGFWILGSGLGFPAVGRAIEGPCAERIAVPPDGACSRPGA